MHRLPDFLLHDVLGDYLAALLGALTVWGLRRIRAWRRDGEERADGEEGGPGHGCGR
ncbi:hypothetical protein [Streptomyces netropsis]|uniref:Uncharacterized protein n=1 Tax=Streptomyces netropsis TaxID=55404 RepID=A0A7W7LFH1_STRNE|nr:hypothetical protein [Streptomyces netropsis]MBB4889197.1 hypothetical protein [Streptomyces netropsis]